MQSRLVAADILQAGAGLKNPRALVGRLRRTQTFLRGLGIEIAFSRESRAGSRIIRIGAIQQNTVSTVSIVRDHGLRVTTTSTATSP